MQEIVLKNRDTNDEEEREREREREREKERERDKSTLYLISANSNQLVRSSYYPDRFTIDS